MAEETKIEWCDHTFNPWRGCSKVAAGCANCYAEVDRSVKIHEVKWGTESQGGTRVVAADSTWNQPHRWNRQASDQPRPRVFCASLADVFEDWQGDMHTHDGHTLLTNSVGTVWNTGETVDDDWSCREYSMSDCRLRLFDTIDATLNLNWLLLTKRPDNIIQHWNAVDRRPAGVKQRYRENVWLGTSIAEQKDADSNIPELLKCRDLAARLFLSIEPLVGPVDVGRWLQSSRSYELLSRFCGPSGFDPTGCQPERKSPTIDWVIVGGESGRNARPCQLEWMRDIVRQCNDAGVPCFVKQLGSNHHAWDVETEAIRWVPLEHPKGGDTSEWPEDLRVQEFPS